MIFSPHTTVGEAAPPRACATLRDLYLGLNELEQLMQLHIHLENNVLLPRAAVLVSEAGIERS
jgi:regulator of cell morphogenesis and NO signaling